jgi:uncharacterized membrane protein YgcG
MKNNRQLIITQARRMVLIAAILGSSAFVARPVSAQTTGTYIEMHGIVTEVNGTLITVNGYTVDYATADRSVTPRLGTFVKIEGWITAPGTIRAAELDRGRRRDSGKVEIVGTAESITGTSIVINGQTYSLVGAEIYAGVAVGQVVKIELLFTANGVVVVEVEVATEDDLADVEDLDDNGLNDDSNDDDSDDSDDDSDDNSDDDPDDNSDDSGSDSDDDVNDDSNDDNGGNSGSDDSGGSDDNGGNSGGDDSGGSDDNGGNSGSDDSGGSDDNGGNSGSDSSDDSNDDNSGSDDSGSDDSNDDSGGDSDDD